MVESIDVVLLLVLDTRVQFFQVTRVLPDLSVLILSRDLDVVNFNYFIHKLFRQVLRFANVLVANFNLISYFENALAKISPSLKHLRLNFNTKIVHQKVTICF